MKNFRSNDGTGWTVSVQLPSHSSAIVLFGHPTGNSRFDRYAIHNSHAPQANDPRSRLDGEAVLSALNDRELARLFRRSVPVEATRERYVVS
jgi:hypothetical protein